MVAGVGETYSQPDAPWMPGGIGRSMDLDRAREHRSSVCMRTRSSRNPHRYSWTQLLHEFATVTERHPDILTNAGIAGGAGSGDAESHWEVDPASGELAPPPPGEVVPLPELPPSHPAVAYLAGRGYDIGKLSDQLSAGFCTREYPRGENGIFYRRMPGGWCDTPQHRLIFRAMVGGVPLTWQGRVIERVDGLDRYMLHPYAGGFFPGDNAAAAIRSHKASGHDGDVDLCWASRRGGYWLHAWSHVATRPNPASDWVPVPPFDEERDGQLRFKPSKYRTAKYSSRQMMGWDAAVRRADADPSDVKWCVLVEGPLDAARCGPGGIGLIGSSLSFENASKIAGKFNLVFLGTDMDKAGRDAAEKIPRQLADSRISASVLTHVIPMPIPSGKDLGDMSQEAYDAMFQRLLQRSQRVL